MPMVPAIRCAIPFACLAALAAAPAALAQGQVAGWGDNSAGQLAPPSPTLLRYERLAVGGYHTLALLSDGSVRCFGSNVYGQQIIPLDLPPVARVFAGSDHNVVILADGTVRTWGDDSFGQCQVPAGLGTVRDLACGEFHTLAVRTDGTIVCWGENGAGQCNVPAGLANPLKVAGGSTHSMAIRADGTVACWGSNANAQCTVPAGLPAATAIAAGRFHSVALLTGGTVRCWGAQNAGSTVNYGQATVPAGLGAVASVDAGDYHTVVRLADGTVRCWGAGTNADVQSPPNMGQCALPDGLGTVNDAQAGAFHSAALMNDGTVRCWGSNRDEQCDLPQDLGTMTAIAAGAFHSLGIAPTGEVRAWGWNAWGQCDVPRGMRDAISIAAGYQHSVAVLDDGTLQAWGDNVSGQATPPGGTNFARVSAGAYHSMALRTDGTVACWGAGTGATIAYPNFAQSRVPVGLNGITRVAAGFFHSMALRANGTVVCWGAGGVGSTAGNDPDYGQSIVPAGLSGVAEIAAGGYHGVALRSNGTVACWGRNNSGQCTVPEGLTGVVAIAAGGNTDYAHTVALLADGTVRGWGDESYRQATAPQGLRNVTAIAAGGYFTLGLLSASASGCADAGGPGLAMVAVNGGSWQDIHVWDWLNGGGPRVPGGQTDVDLGSYGSVGSTCDAMARTLTAHAGSSLLVPVDLTIPASAQPDHSIDVLGTATLAGRIFLLGSGASTLPEDLDIPVLRSANPVSTFDIVQTNVPPPPGKFLALVPSPGVQGLTLYSLRLLDLPGNASLTGSTAGGFSGVAVAAEAMDWNGDGFDDLALAIDFGASQPGLLQVLLNDGQGNLGLTSVQAVTAAQPRAMAVGNFNNDGRTDVAVATASDNRGRVYLTNVQSQSPPFNPGAAMVVNGTPLSMAAIAPAPGSTNPIGPICIGSAGTAFGPGGGKCEFYSPATGEQTATCTLSAAPQTTSTRGIRIVTGGSSSSTYDGLLPGASGLVSIIVRDPVTAAWTVTQTLPVPGTPVATEIADIDGDGNDDVVTANADPVLQGAGTALPVLTLFRGGAAGFGGAVPIAPQGATAGLDVALVDADGDGDRDIVCVQRGLGTASAAVLVQVDTAGPGGPLTLGTETALNATRPTLCARGNLDGIGGEDLFLVDAGGGSAFLPTGPVAKPFLGAQPNPCPADLDHSGAVNGADLGLLLSNWGGSGTGDLNGDGTVNGADLGLLLSAWGPCGN